MERKLNDQWAIADRCKTANKTIDKPQALIKMINSTKYHNRAFSILTVLTRGEFSGLVGGRGCRRTSSFRDSIPCRPNGSPFELIWDIHLWLTDPKTFLMAPLAPIYTKFKRGARIEKTQFFGNNFSKKAEKTPFWPFFHNFACGSKQGLLSALGEIGKSIWST